MHARISPILIKHIPADIFEVIIDANCDNSILNGHYEENEFCPPKWYKKLLKQQNPVLAINQIDTISVMEQTKFIKLIKYKKNSTFKLPEHCIIIVTCNNIQNINDELLSEMVYI